MALISTQASLASRIPFMHFFDGFRTSHEIQKVEELTYDDMLAMIDEDLIIAHRERGPDPGPAHHPRHRPESRCLLHRPRDRQQVLQRHARHHPGDHGQVRGTDRPPVPPL